MNNSSKMNISSCLNGTFRSDVIMNDACLKFLSVTSPPGRRKDETEEFNLASVYFLLVLCSLAVFENVFTCYIIYANKILQTATNTFVFSLCITDILCAGVLLPIAVFYKNSHVYLYLAAIIVFTYSSNLTAVTYERLVSITKPLRYRSIITKQTALKITIAAWVIPVSFGLLPLTWNTNVLGIEHKVYIIIALLVFLVSPLFFICFVYIRILIEVHRLLKDNRHLEVYSSQSSPSAISISDRLRRSCCFCVNDVNKQGEGRRSSRRHMSRDSNDDMSCTFKTDLIYSAASSQSLSCQRSDGRYSITFRNSCDSGRNCNHGEVIEKCQYLTVDGGLSLRSAQQKCSSNASLCHDQTDDTCNGNKCRGPYITTKIAEIQDSQVDDNVIIMSSNVLQTGSSCKEVLIDKGSENVVENRCNKNSKDVQIEGMSLSDIDSLTDSQSQNFKGRVGFLISMPSGNEADDDALDDGVDADNGPSEHDSGIEEERFKDGMKASEDVENRAEAAVVLMNTNEEPCMTSSISCKNVEGGNLCQSIEETETQQKKSNKSERSSLLKRFKGNAETGEPRPPKRRGRSIRRRHVFEEIKASTAFALVAFTYMFTWIPVIYMTFMEAIDKAHLVPASIVNVNTWTIAINAAVDPLFYALILRNFRKTIKRQFRRMRNGCN